ncbi:MAG: hypothetical protein ACK40G_05870 [Cytophagaceae bacterium]
MKIKSSNVFWLPCLVLLLFACGQEKKVNHTLTSPDGKNEIIVSGTKASFADPFIVKFLMKDTDAEVAPFVEIYSSDINSENFNYKWENNQTCILNFTQQDNTTRKFVLEMDEEELFINEIQTE